MDLVEMLTLLGTIAAVVFSWSTFLLNLKSREESSPADDLEERILELMGRFKHVSSIKLEMLEKKIEEIRKVMREANDVYSSLMVKLSDIMKIKDEIPETVKDLSVNTVVERNTVEENETGEVMENVGEPIDLERRIINMHDEGFSDIEIARRLGIGVGEVRLIIGLFGRDR